MKLITRDTDYAIRALCAMGRRPQERVSVGQLTETLRVPRPFLRKILQELNRAGVLHSSRGVGGGFSLARPVAGIRLEEIIKIFQGPLELNECLLSRKACPEQGSCPLRKRLCAIEARVQKEIAGVTIGTLLRDNQSSQGKSHV